MMESNQNKPITALGVDALNDTAKRVSSAARALLEALPPSSEERQGFLQQVLGRKLAPRALRVISTLARAHDAADDGLTKAPIAARRSTTSASLQVQGDATAGAPGATAQASSTTSAAPVVSCRSCAGEVLSLTQDARRGAIVVLCIRCGDSWIFPSPTA